MNEEKIFTGALLDERPDSEKELDPKFEEVVASASPVKWEEKKTYRSFPVLDQRRSMMCGAFSWKKLMGIYYWLKYGVWLDFSEEDIYQRRFNKPGAGMAVDDIYKIANEGVTLKVLTGADIYTDADADNLHIESFKRDVGKVFAMGKKITVTSRDIDTIASIIQTTGKAVHYMFGFETREWARFIPEVYNPSLNLYAPNTDRHFVVFVDYTLKNGEKCLVTEDSSHFGGLPTRLVNQAWLDARTIAITYPMNFKFEDATQAPTPTPVPVPTPTPAPSKPKHTFNVNLTYSPVVKYGNPDIVALQNILKYEGVFPSNVSSTGYYGSLTAQAVLAFQRKHQVAPEAELASLEGKLVGIKTRAKLNQLYS